MTEENSSNTIEIKYNNKTYVIEKTEGEQTVLPKGQIKVLEGEHLNKDEITVKDYKEGFWDVSANINGSQVKIKWGKGKYLSFIGLPAILLAIGLAVYFFVYRKKRKLIEKKEKDQL